MSADVCVYAFLLSRVCVYVYFYIVVIVFVVVVVVVVGTFIVVVVVVIIVKVVVIVVLIIVVVAVIPVSSGIRMRMFNKYVVGSIFMVDPLRHFSFQPELHDWCNKGRGMCYPI